MKKIEHKFIEANGLKHHVAEIGSSASPAILFLHGFPEIWYTWRYQMIAVANAGYRAIAPDYRGYGLSDAPSQPYKATFSDFIADMAAILDALAIPKVLLTTNYHETLPEGFYVTRWQKPGRAEADFARLDAKTVWRNIYILFSKSEIPIAAEKQDIMDLVEPSDSLPSWITEEGLAIYGASYEKSGYQTALQVPYREIRAMQNTPQPTNAPDPKVEAPALYITGEKDNVFKLPAMENYIRSGAVKTFVPNLEIEYITEGTHFVGEQFPDKVNELILSFISKNIQ